VSLNMERSTQTDRRVSQRHHLVVYETNLKRRKNGVATPTSIYLTKTRRVAWPGVSLEALVERAVVCHLTSTASAMAAKNCDVSICDSFQLLLTTFHKKAIPASFASLAFGPGSLPCSECDHF